MLNNLEKLKKIELKGKKEFIWVVYWLLRLITIINYYLIKQIIIIIN